jgi:hypothetical protein
LPIHPVTKVPLLPEGAATKSEPRIRHWWKQKPYALAGIIVEGKVVPVTDLPGTAAPTPHAGCPPPPEPTVASAPPARQQPRGTGEKPSAQATIDDLRRQLLANGYQPIAVETGGKRPVAPNWQESTGLPRFEASATNTGILTVGLRAIDVDVDDPEKAALVSDSVLRHFGEAPLRTRTNSSRFSVLYRAAEGEPRKRIIKLACGEIEVLGAGQQVVVLGDHPSGAQYQWQNASPLDTPRAELSAISAEQIATFETELLASFGGEPPKVAVRQFELPKIPTLIGQSRLPEGPIPAGRRAAYLAKVLEDEVASVATAAPGGRNIALNRAALRLGHHVGHDGFDEGEVVGRLTVAAAQCDLTQDDGPNRVAATIMSGLTAGMREPADLPQDLRHGPTIAPANGVDRNGSSAPRGGAGARHEWEAAARTARGQANADAPIGRALPFIDFADMDTASRKGWVVHHLFGLGEASIWYGEPGSGKSVLVGDLGVHVAAGRTWHGRQIKQGAVLYVALERAGVVARRAIALRTEYGLGALPFAMARGPLDLRTPQAADDIVATMEQLANRHNCEPALVIIDTVSRALAGGDENSPKDMGLLVTNLARIQEGVEAHLLLTHHQPVDGKERMRGHGALLAAADTTVHVTKTGSARLAEVVKSSDHEEGQQVPFTLKSVVINQDEFGDDVTAPVVMPAESWTEVEIAKRPAKMPAGATIALRALYEAVDALGAEPPASNYIPPKTRAVKIEQWRDYAYRSGITTSPEPRARQLAFQRAVQYLRANNKVGIWDPHVWLP